MRNVSVVAVMVVLSACASAAPPDESTAKFQNAVYRVGDQPAQMPASAKPGEARPAEARPAVDMQAPSKLMHVYYWFFSGR
jgi:hypothetical protein